MTELNYLREVVVWPGNRPEMAGNRRKWPETGGNNCRKNAVKVLGKWTCHGRFPEETYMALGPGYKFDDSKSSKIQSNKESLSYAILC